MFSTNNIVLLGAIAVGAYFWTHSKCSCGCGGEKMSCNNKVERMRAPAMQEQHELFINDDDPKAKALLDKKRSDRGRDETITAADFDTKSPPEFAPAFWPATYVNPPRIDTRSEW